MNKVTLAFATSTVGLAVAAGSLWKQLDAERDRAQVEAQQRGQLQARLAKLEHERHPTPAPNTATTAAPPPRIVHAASATTRPDAAGNGDIDPIDLYNIQQQKRRQEARRRMLEDPRERELLKAQARSEARAANADLARELQLTDGEYDRLIERLAEYDLQLSELFSREERAPTGAQNDYQTLRDQLAQDIADLLGYEKAQQYAAFEDSRQVRTQVRRLRGRLSEGEALTDEQNQRLIAALQKERLSFNREIERRIPNERVSATRGTWDGGTFRADRASNVAMQEQFTKQMEEFAKRMRQSAAEVLTAHQLRAFAQMQDEMLTEQRLEARTMTLVDESN